ncbi:MAG TPA: bifunctional DNA-formamidopyrimidine glycosylase/DNA-(apurinic or apyrimidinic site) lyase [bacterium]|nr:bifunctional DNA-formamidopyrimidine glycosylase/DNA-(apurinic or apyrimidinic site) lyase [bacterium]HPL95241.1 bifunctional DNA-formamidopyrimidine glycosylase/DNA-(apurinic or apyrimidinic site) lyase [bacterium]
MPELPEVETIKLELSHLIKDKKIKSVTLNLAKQVKGDRQKFLKLITGAKIKNISRRAKTLIFELSNIPHPHPLLIKERGTNGAKKYYLVFHLKMTGQLIYRGKSGKLIGGGHPIKQDLKELPNKYSHVIFNFNDGTRLFFNDQRQFGWVKLVDETELKKMDNDYGPEPLSKEFNLKYFEKYLAQRNTAIKPLLMEQKFIAGIGNIYAAEACFCAGLNPTLSAKKIKLAVVKKLYQCIQNILKLAIKKKGTSADNYVDAFGREGQMINFLKVYGGAGEKCYRCKNILHEIRQGSRATVYCPKCQK